MPEKNGTSFTGEMIDELQQTVETLSQEVLVLRNVLDEIRDDFRWALQNDRAELIPQNVVETDDVLHFGVPAERIENDKLTEFVPPVIETEIDETPILEKVVDTLDENRSSLKSRIVEYLAARMGAVPLQEIRDGLGFSTVNSANPIYRTLMELQDAGNVSAIESELGEPSFLFQCPFYLRADRQENFGGIPCYEWPEAIEDRNTLTVDRLGQNGDGGEHRFTVKRGDTVEAFFSNAKQKVGQVAGISQTNREVRVAFREGSEGTWFAIGSIYPALETDFDANAISDFTDNEPVHQANDLQEKSTDDVVPFESSRSDSAEFLFPDSHGEDVESVTEHQRPYQFDDFQTFLKRLQSGNLSAIDLQNDFARLQSSQKELAEQLIHEKNAIGLKNLAFRFGCLSANRNTKQQNAESVIRSMMLSYTLKNSVTYQPFSGETYEDAISKVVESLTDADIQQQLEEQNKQSEQIEKSLTNPETLSEFRQFVDQKSEEQLNHEQLIRYDQLRADQSRSERANQKTTTVEQFSGDVTGLQITIKEGFHTRQKIPLWICQLSERIDRATFSDLKFKAKQLGGWWSSFKKDDAGFQFKNEDSAEKFQSLLQGNTDRSDELETHKTRKIESASERLSQLADDLERTANESLTQDRLTNTVRRSEMAANIREHAYANIAFAQTMRSVTTDLASGTIKYIDNIRTKTQLTTLVNRLNRAKQTRNKTLLKEKENLNARERHNTVEELNNRPITTEDTDFAEYPFPTVYKRDLDNLIARAENKNGIKQRAQKLKKSLTTGSDFITFTNEQKIKDLTEFTTRCKAAGLHTEPIDRSLDDYKRLRTANIQTLPELRMALRELIPHLKKQREDDPITKAEQSLIGQKLEGFFPTPKPIITHMLELAEIAPEHTILEPSAGKGDILDMLRDQHPENKITAIELNHTLSDILTAKKHTVEQADFLEHTGQYDRILMNPPFEKNSDIKHIYHAYNLLTPNGKLIAIMSEGPFFRNDQTAIEFRNWLENVGGVSEQLPEDAFNNSETFRKTGVRTRIVIITK